METQKEEEKKVAQDPGIDWVVIPPGSFEFGSPYDTPCRGAFTEKQVPVTLTRSFVIARTELTQKQWAAMALPIPPNMPACADCPIQYVNFFDSLAWCNALSRFEGLEECYDLSHCDGTPGSGCPLDVAACNDGLGAYSCEGTTRKYSSMYDCQGYRLPTDAEWEYAARAGLTTNTYNGDITSASGGICVNEPILNDIAWYCFNTSGSEAGWQPYYVKPVGMKQPNPWGLYDMLGNAAEWTDYVTNGFGLDYAYGGTGELLIDPMGPTEADGTSRDLRGGFFFFVSCYIRTNNQSQETAEVRGPGYGFRPVRTLPSPDAGVDGGGK